MTIPCQYIVLSVLCSDQFNYPLLSDILVPVTCILPCVCDAFAFATKLRPFLLTQTSKCRAFVSKASGDDASFTCKGAPSQVESESTLAGEAASFSSHCFRLTFYPKYSDTQPCLNAYLLFAVALWQTRRAQMRRTVSAMLRPAHLQHPL